MNFFTKTPFYSLFSVTCLLATQEEKLFKQMSEPLKNYWYSPKKVDQLKEEIAKKNMLSCLTKTDTKYNT